MVFASRGRLLAQRLISIARRCGEPSYLLTLRVESWRMADGTAVRGLSIGIASRRVLDPVLECPHRCADRSGIDDCR
jgi:hypothetical protein